MRIVGLQRPGLEALIRACVADPTCTPGRAALRVIGAEGGGSVADPDVRFGREFVARVEARRVLAFAKESVRR